MDSFTLWYIRSIRKEFALHTVAQPRGLTALHAEKRRLHVSFYTGAFIPRAYSTASRLATALLAPCFHFRVISRKPTSNCVA